MNYYYYHLINILNARYANKPDGSLLTFSEAVKILDSFGFSTVELLREKKILTAKMIPNTAMLKNRLAIPLSAISGPPPDKERLKEVYMITEKGMRFLEYVLVVAQAMYVSSYSSI